MPRYAWSRLAGADLQYVRVAAIAGTETIKYLCRRHLAWQVIADGETALAALQNNRIDALARDRPLLL